MLSKPRLNQSINFCVCTEHRGEMLVCLQTTLVTVHQQKNYKLIGRSRWKIYDSTMTRNFLPSLACTRSVRRNIG